VKLQVDVRPWLLSNPNGPLRKEQEQEQEQSLLLELRTAKKAKQPGGGSPEHNLQPPAGGQAGATVGGE
jgi:hypothetical protein